MAIPQAVHIDRLVLSDLGEPLLNEYYGSAGQRQDVIAIAEEIKRRHLAKLPRETGNLASTAKITTPRVKHKYDSRYEAVYTIGGGRADYIVPLEAEHHYLDEVLREMGFYVPDAPAAPRGRNSRDDELITVYHRSRTKEGAEAAVNQGFAPGSRGDFIYFNLDLNSASSSRGDHVVVAQVRRGDLYRDLEDEGRSVRARRQVLSDLRYMEHRGEVPDTFPETPAWLKDDGIVRPRLEE